MKLEVLKTCRKAIGAKQTAKAVTRGETSFVYLGADSEDKIAAPLMDLCKEHEVNVDRNHTMEELGKACRIKVKAAAVAVLD